MTQANHTAKEVMLEILDRQPADSSYEELLRELAFGQVIQRGLADLDAGRTVSHEDMKRESESWRR